MGDENHFNRPSGESPGNIKLSNVCTAYLNIQGMESPECVVLIYQVLRGIEGVIRVGIVQEKGIAAVVHNLEKVSSDALVHAIETIDCVGKEPYQAEVWMLTDAYKIQ